MSFAWSTFAETTCHRYEMKFRNTKYVSTLENMDTLPMKAAFLDVGSFIGEVSLEIEFGMVGDSLGDVTLPSRLVL